MSLSSCLSTENQLKSKITKPKSYSWLLFNQIPSLVTILLKTPLCRRPDGIVTLLEKKSPESFPVEENPSNFVPIGKNCKVLIWIWDPNWTFGLENNENTLSYKIKDIFYPHWEICSKFYPTGYENSSGSVRQVSAVSYTHLTLPTIYSV